MANQLRRFWEHYRGAQGIVRELLTIALCLGIGLLVMPCLIFAAGRTTLQTYAHGNLFALWHDYLAGLTTGSLPAWFILAGPYLLVWVTRGWRRLLHN